MSHEVTYAPGEGGTFLARCTCKQSTMRFVPRQQAEEWELHHLQQAERAKAGLGNKNPSLSSQRDHYRMMELDPDVSEYDRGLWRQLREELDRRLNDQKPVEQDTLFGDVVIQEKSRAKKPTSSKSVGH